MPGLDLVALKQAGGALATFTWRGTPAGSFDLRQVGPAGWTATADPGADSAASAVNGDASTRYTTGAAQTGGQYLQVDVRAYTR